RALDQRTIPTPAANGHNKAPPTAASCRGTTCQEKGSAPIPGLLLQTGSEPIVKLIGRSLATLNRVIGSTAENAESRVDRAKARLLRQGILVGNGEAGLIARLSHAAQRPAGRVERSPADQADALGGQAVELIGRGHEALIDFQIADGRHRGDR